MKKRVNSIASRILKLHLLCDLEGLQQTFSLAAGPYTKEASYFRRRNLLLNNNGLRTQTQATKTTGYIGAPDV
jgi:hypothetical protein